MPRRSLHRRPLFALALLGLAITAPRTALGLCVESTCEQNNVSTACHTESWTCLTNSCGGPVPYVHAPTQRGNKSAAPAISPCISICAQVLAWDALPGTACESDADACTSDVCGSGSSAGVCTHDTGGGALCNGVCLQSGCCASPNSCSGGKVCPANGGACQCAAGKKDCNGGCIDQAQCCLDADCPGDPSGHRHGICGASGCGYACDMDYLPCGPSCIPSSQCCTSADCQTPPNGCYQPIGTCTTGACTYGFADGASCNADNDLCTPNDHCESGVCIADGSNRVHCIQRECHSSPVCNPATGNCDDAIVSGACGADGCAPAGTCAAGNCSTQAQAVDCSSLDGVCRVGMCDPGQAGTAYTSEKCGTANKPNGLACPVADKCVVAPACNGGVCVGTPRTCIPSGPCVVAVCNPTTGGCEESAAPVGTSCAASATCVENASCDTTGACSGPIVPDGTPCDSASCAVGATCASGTCGCVDLPGGASDAPGPSSGSGQHGCSMGGRAPARSCGGALLVALAFLIARRRLSGSTR